MGHLQKVMVLVRIDLERHFGSMLPCSYFVAMNHTFTCQRLGVRCRAERVHRFGVGKVGHVELFETRWLQSQSGNVASSGAALQDLAEY